jgi:magnesium-transporting ATPase (P-type)
MRTADGERKFFFGGQVGTGTRQNNFVRTSKYTPLNFFPKCLLYEFTQLSNLYFLMIAILESIPAVSPSLNYGAAWLPLAIVVGISMLRELVEDKQRQKSDHDINSTQCSVYRTGQWVQVTWGEVRVGELILIEDEGVLPADSILIESGLSNGVAFVETTTLDG